nr:hypothetical protein AVEN_8336-1 [Araneus ventricosus]GBL72838.1 hypothetical protein AVEN_72656-1 [Araneus ventricosus]
MKFANLLDKDAGIQKAAELLKNHHAAARGVGDGGEKIIAALHGSFLQSSSLNEIRFTIFTKSLLQSNFNLTTFPPTEETARLHSRRTFLQVNLWTGHVLDRIK